MFDHWTPGQEIVLKRNPNYWEAGTPYLDEITFDLSVNPQTGFLKLQRGEVDVLGDNLPPANVVQREGRSRLEALRLLDADHRHDLPLPEHAA